MIAFEVPKGPIDDWYAMGKVMLNGQDVTQFSDPGDEDDYEQKRLYAEWLVYRALGVL